MSDFNSYYMLVALAVREKANCIGRKVSAIIVKENRIIGTGYNGTPEGMQNCEDGGCIRCNKHRDQGNFYDKCICVHAEQNAMITAARFGHEIQDSVIYSTLQPCFTCAKEFLQAKIKTYFYLEEIKYKSDKKIDKDFKQQYEILIGKFEKHPTQLEKNELTKNLSNIKSYLNKI